MAKINFFKLGLVCVFVTVILTGCMDIPTTTSVSCTITFTSGADSLKQCYGYLNIDVSYAATVSASCIAASYEGYEGVSTEYSASACDPTGSVGTCLLPAAGATPEIEMTLYPDYNATSGELACSGFGGTWSGI